MKVLWESRVALAAAVECAEQEIEAAKNGEETVAAEDRWGKCWDSLHDLDDQIMAKSAALPSDIAIKARVRLLRGNEDFPYAYCTQSPSRDVSTRRGLHLVERLAGSTAA